MNWMDNIGNMLNQIAGDWVWAVGLVVLYIAFNILPLPFETEMLIGYLTVMLVLRTLDMADYRRRLASQAKTVSGHSTALLD